MGYDQRLHQIDIILTSGSYESFKPKSLQKKHPLMFFEMGTKWKLFERNLSNTKRKHKASKKSSVKKKAPEFHALIVPARIIGEKLDVEVNKKGGEFKLIGGSKVSIEENIFLKKTIISSYIIPPNKRQDYPVKLEYQEYLISEIFLFSSKSFPKRQLKFFIPSLTETNRYCYLLSCTTEHFLWTPVPKFDFISDGITFLSEKWGYYAIIERQPFENINIGANGGLINTRVHPMISLRIPKNSIPIESVCFLQYLKNRSSTIGEMTSCYPFELTNIVNVSSMVSFGFPAIQFKRQITIKLPLPPWAEQLIRSNENHNKSADLMLLCKRHGNWEPIETRINYTKNTFTFESKVFGTFILVEPRSNREGKVRHSLSRLEYVNNLVKGIFLVFLYFESKAWYIWIELVSISKALSVRHSREEGGLIFIEQMIVPKVPTQEKSGKPSRTKSVISGTSECSRIVELSDGMIFHITLDGDVQFKESNFHIPILSKQFQKSVETTLKKQSPVALSSLQKSMHEQIVEELEEDPTDNFLQNLGKKKMSSVKDQTLSAATDLELSLEDSQCLSIIFYSVLSENYRILEIEPKKQANFEDDITLKWKNKEVIKSNMEPVVEVEDADKDLLDSFDSVPQDISSKNTSSLSDNSELQENLEAMLELKKVYQAHSPEAKSRIELGVPEESNYTYCGTLKITRDKSCFQIPPNQLNFENELRKSFNEDNKQKVLHSYLPPDIFQSEYQYKFYVEPEEMREYFGIIKPSVADVLKLKQEKADSLVNVYLKDVKIGEVDQKVLEKAKKSAIKKLISKESESVQITDFTLKDLKKSKVDVAHKVRDRLDGPEMYRIPKVLSEKSLQVLSQYIDNGLKLATHLQIPDSVINDIGFDSVSTNQTLTEVTHKVLLHWKRSFTPDNRPQMLSGLIESLRTMELDSIANLIQDVANKNEELTPDHFLKVQDNKIETLDTGKIEDKTETTPTDNDVPDIQDNKE